MGRTRLSGKFAVHSCYLRCGIWRQVMPSRGYGRHQCIWWFGIGGEGVPWGGVGSWGGGVEKEKEKKEKIEKRTKQRGKTGEKNR